MSRLLWCERHQSWQVPYLESMCHAAEMMFGSIVPEDCDFRVARRIR